MAFRRARWTTGTNLTEPRSRSESSPLAVRHRQGVQSIGLNPEALTTRDNKGETPIDIARRSRACATRGKGSARSSIHVHMAGTGGAETDLFPDTDARGGLDASSALAYGKRLGGTLSKPIYTYTPATGVTAALVDVYNGHGALEINLVGKGDLNIMFTQAPAPALALAPAGSPPTTSPTKSSRRGQKLSRRRGKKLSRRRGRVRRR